MEENTPSAGATSSANAGATDSANTAVDDAAVHAARTAHMDDTTKGMYYRALTMPQYRYYGDGQPLLIDVLDPSNSGHEVVNGRIRKIVCSCGRVLIPDANGNAPCECGVVMGVVRYRVPSKPQGRLAKFPLVRPDDDAAMDAWAAYRGERRKRVVQKAERRGRIARREQPHEVDCCAMCQHVYASAMEHRERDISVREVAAASMMSINHVYRVLSANIEDRRGLRTLTSMRRIAHDGLGISLDELAILLELK
jgi:hypothetical protein